MHTRDLQNYKFAFWPRLPSKPHFRADQIYNTDSCSNIKHVLERILVSISINRTKGGSQFLTNDYFVQHGSGSCNWILIQFLNISIIWMNDWNFFKFFTLSGSYSRIHTNKQFSVFVTHVIILILVKFLPNDYNWQHIPSYFGAFVWRGNEIQNLFM